MASSQMGGVEAVRITGLREARKQFKDVDVGFLLTQKEMTKDIAAEVAGAARSKAKSFGGSMAKGASTIKPYSTASKAGIRFGGPQAPWMSGAEFGSVRFRQFPAWRGNGTDAGYVIFLTIRQLRNRIEERAAAFVEKLLEVFAS